MAARNTPAKAGKKGAPDAGGAKTDLTQDLIESGDQLDAAAEAAKVIAEAAQPEPASTEGEAAIPPTPPVIIGGVPAHVLKDIDKATPARSGARATGEQHLASATCSQP
ncbi:Pyruvate kinase [Candidatus Burkholderia humilis]|nr:Pyruvate kinase [Candidatus Burkholderia humilis]